MSTPPRPTRLPEPNAPERKPLTIYKVLFTNWQDNTFDKLTKYASYEYQIKIIKKIEVLSNNSFYIEIHSKLNREDMNTWINELNGYLKVFEIQSEGNLVD